MSRYTRDQIRVPQKIGIAFEQAARDEGFRRIAGLDEVGRGALAGPVVAAAVILDLSLPLPEKLNDSKKLSATRRELVAKELRERAICYAVGVVDAPEIDRINILQATKQAMRLALENLSTTPDFLLIDALELKEVALPQRAIIGGDAISASIAAASIIAKTFRDKLMQDYDETFPCYGFARHVGYGTQAHLAAIIEHGACPLHRKTFRGVLPPTAPALSTTTSSREG